MLCCLCRKMGMGCRLSPLAMMDMTDSAMCDVHLVSVYHSSMQCMVRVIHVVLQRTTKSIVCSFSVEQNVIQNIIIGVTLKLPTFFASTVVLVCRRSTSEALSTKTYKRRLCGTDSRTLRNSTHVNGNSISWRSF